MESPGGGGGDDDCAWGVSVGGPAAGLSVPSREGDWFGEGQEKGEAVNAAELCVRAAKDPELVCPEIVGGGEGTGGEVDVRVEAEEVVDGVRG